MNISPEGKNYLTQVLAESEIKSLRFFGVQGCCGMNLSVALDPAQETDKVETIDGITVAVDPAIEGQLTDVTIHAEEENGELGLVLIGLQSNFLLRRKRDREPDHDLENYIVSLIIQATMA